MKNRLQFNRIPTVFSGATETRGGEEVWVSGREQAAEALENYIKRGSFIPLIGEPIVLRYTDDKGDRQAMLAIGKSTGASLDMVNQREYHIIDTAALQEGVDSATETANEAYDMASAATKDVANYLVILKNMILSGIGLSDGTYFDTDDPSGCGLYDSDKVDDTFYLKEATSFLDADKKLDAALVATNAWLNGRADNLQSEIDKEHGYRKAIAIKEIDQQYYERLGLGDDIKAAYFLTTHKPGDGNFDQYDYPQNGEVIIKVYKDEVSREEFENVLAAEGLNPDGTYDHERAHDSVNFKDAFDAFTADELLDQAIANLSAGTVAADAALNERVEELESHEVFGQDAIETEEDENGDTTVSLKIYENEKVLSQSNQGLRSTIKLVYVPADKKIYLNGIDDVEISHIDTDDFVKDGMLDSANIIVATEEDHAAHPELVVGETYIKLVFNTDAETGGKQSPVFISAKDLVDEYKVSATSLNYLTIEGYEIRANVDVEHGLAGYDTLKFISGLTENIISGAGLNLLNPGAYPGHDDTNYIKDAGSLDQADVLLDSAIGALSGVVADLGDMSELEEKLNQLSAVTKEFSATTDTLIRELSARTVDLGEVYEALSAVSGDIVTYVLENEETTAAALNDLNERVATVETRMTGEYIPLTGYEISSGLTEDELIIKDEDSVNDAFGKLQKQVLDNEETVAAGLNDLNRRVLANSQAIAENTGVTELSGAVVTLSADTYYNFNNIYSSITNINTDVTDIESSLTVVQSSLTIVNSGLTVLSGVVKEISGLTDGVLTVELNGEVQGKYSPSADTLISLTAITEVTGADVLLTGYEISTGTTEEELVVVATDTVNEAFGKVQKQYYDNEAVVAGALNDLDDRIVDLEDTVVKAISVNGGTPISANSENVVNIQLDVPAVNNFFDGAEYVSSAKTIIFTHDNTVIDSIDATNFIKDGMVDNVATGTPSSGPHAGVECLIITFNADAGKETIEIPLSDIFDASLLDDLSGSVVNNFNLINSLSADMIDNELVIAAAFNDINSRIFELSGKSVDLSNYYTKGQTDDLINSLSSDTVNYVKQVSGDIETVINQLMGGGLTGATATGNGNVLTSVAVDNNQVVLGKGMTVASSADTVAYINNVSSNTVNYIKQVSGDIETVINQLMGGGITGATTAGTGNVVTSVSVSNNQAILEKGIEVASSADTVNYIKQVSGDIETVINQLDGVTGVTMNGSPVTVTNKVADLGTVLTSFTETQLSTSEAGAGNVVGSISVDNHKIVANMFNAASAQQLATLSGVVENITNLGSGLTGVSMNGSNVSITNGVAILGTVITGETQLSKADNGTGNVVTSISVNNHKVTVGKDMNVMSSGETIAYVENLSADTINYIKQVSGDIETVINQLMGGGLTGATSTGTGNVFTSVSVNNNQVVLNKGLEVMSSGDTIQYVKQVSGNIESVIAALDGITGVTMNGNPVTVNNKNANLGTVVTAQTQLSVETASTPAGNVIGGISVNNHKITATMFSAASAEQISALSAATVALGASEQNYFTDAEYDSNNKRINFKHGNTVVDYIDASAFIKDGMVDNVTVTNNNLVITFNTDAGKEAITIPISQIFDADDYYTKAQINNGVSAVTKSLSGSLVSLSAATVSHSGDTTRHITSAERTKWNNGANSGASAWTELIKVSGVVETLENLGGGLTGVTFNGNAATVADRVAAILFNETQLSTASTGTGNVVGGIGVNNHSITTTMFSAASAEQLVNLSASTVNLSSATVNLSSVTSNLSAGTVSLGQKMKKFGEEKSSGNIDLNKYLTVYSVSAGATAKTLTCTISNDTLSEMEVGEVIESQVILDNSNGSSDVQITFTTDISGATITGTLGRYDRTIGWVDAGGYGEASILLMKISNSIYKIYIITT